jgi:hypothetical protein
MAITSRDGLAAVALAGPFDFEILPREVMR